jgi:hypothetical protein
MDTNNQNGPDESEWLTLHNSIKWINGAIFQGDRLLNISNKINDLYASIRETENNSNSNFLIMQKIKSLNEECKIEEEFFLFAIDRAIFSLKEATKCYSEFSSFLTEIENALGAGNVKDVRDMRTHIDKYAKGKGNVQDRFIYKSSDDLYPSKPFADHLFAADATSTIVLDGVYLIGGRVNVQIAMETLKKIQPSIQEACDKYMFSHQVKNPDFNC